MVGAGFCVVVKRELRREIVPVAVPAAVAVELRRDVLAVVAVAVWASNEETVERPAATMTAKSKNFMVGDFGGRPSLARPGWVVTDHFGAGFALDRMAVRKCVKSAETATE